jgi:hypothetical protein
MTSRIVQLAFLFLALACCVLLAGCGGRKTPLAVACEKLEIDHCSKMTHEIDMRIGERLKQQSPEITLKLAAINSRIDPLTSKTFLVDLNRYQAITSRTSFVSSATDEKLDRIKVFAFAAPLPVDPASSKMRASFNDFSRLELTARENSPGAKKYRQVKEACEAISIIPCKVNYTGVLDGVWKNKQGNSSVLSGWIDVEEIAMVPFALEDLVRAAHKEARNSVFKIIQERNGEIGWLQIEAEVNRVVTEIK